MRVITDKNILLGYIEKFNINEIFQGEIIKEMEIHCYKEGEQIYSIDEEPVYFYLLVKGKLKVYFLLDNGKKVLLRFNKPLGVLGDIELMGDYRVKANVEAVNECLLLGIRMEYIRKFVLKDPKFLQFIIKHLSYKLYTISNAMALNLSYSLEKKLASYLVSIASDEHNVKRIDEIKTTNVKEIAELLGASYRHMNRILKNFCDRGIIKKEEKQLIIEDYEQLKKISAGLYE